MTNVKGRVTDELKKATTWLSTNDLVGLLSLSHSSVGRALRRLWDKDVVRKEKMVGDRYGRMQWIHADKDDTRMIRPGQLTALFAWLPVDFEIFQLPTAIAARFAVKKRAS